MKRTVMVLAMSLVATLGAPWANAGQQYGYGGGQRGQYTAPAPYAQSYNTPRGGNWNSGYRDNDRDTQRFDNRGYNDHGYNDHGYNDHGYNDHGYNDRRYNTYNNGRYDRYDHHVGRSVAIIGGSAAGGALIGGLAGQGKGAAVGAVVGGVAGLIGDQIARHHDHRR